MPELLILRHAKSDWGDSSLRDYDRPLAPRGRKAAPKMGGVIADIGHVDQVIASPARRVVETLEEVRDTAPGLPEPKFVASLYGASVSHLLSVLREHGGEADRLMIVGHNPGLYWLALGLVEGQGGKSMSALEEKFPTAALAQIEFDGSWSELREGSGRLLRFVRPKDL